MYKKVANKPSGSEGSNDSLERRLVQVFSMMEHINPPVVGSNNSGIQKKGKCKNKLLM